MVYTTFGRVDYTNRGLGYYFTFVTRVFYFLVLGLFLDNKFGRGPVQLVFSVVEV